MPLLQRRAALALEYVKETDMSYTLIGRILGVSTETVWSWTTGRCPVSDTDLLKLAYLADHKTLIE